MIKDGGKSSHGISCGGRRTKHAGVPVMQSEVGAYRHGNAGMKRRGGTESGLGMKPQHL